MRAQFNSIRPNLLKASIDALLRLAKASERVLRKIHEPSLQYARTRV